MLKRLELIGFKSFAEKTQFDFGPGITAIVGPNGSGKSNIVDGVRWIMGEQSAKSLRGGEMADVIFNGSSTRRSLGMAEVSLYLDNSKRSLSVDADEVQITRRVYRDGQGEYLINRQPSRLKDIKEMFLGSGAGTDAYSIIEQGRVDVLLQSSTKDRRAIFEEAAGISRFRAKKVETLRKLERVDQNLLRLRDIIDEVDRQLRAMKLQAAKAERFQEYSENLKQLRVALSLDEHHGLTLQLQRVTAELETTQAALALHANLVATHEADGQGIEVTLAGTETELRKAENALADARQLIATHEATLEHEQALTGAIDEDLARSRTTLQALTVQLLTMDAEDAKAAADWAAAQAECIEQRAEVEQLDSDVNRTTARLAELRRQVQANQDALFEQLRATARLHNEQVSLKAQAASLTQHRQRVVQKSALAAQSLSQVDAEVQTLAQAAATLQTQLDAVHAEHDGLRHQSEATSQAIDDWENQLGLVREERSALTSRIDILERLEQAQQGLSAGVREALALARQDDAGPWNCVVGLVAELLSVPREYAALIDLALGERAHHCLVHDMDSLWLALLDRKAAFAGRVTFLPLRRLNSAPVGTANRLLSGSSGPRLPPPSASEPTGSTVSWVAAASLVTCDNPHYAQLPELLLGDTRIVSNLAMARDLARQFPATRFVTLQGELLEPDGVVTVGEHHAEAGLLSRKSELRELRETCKAADERIGRIESQLRALLAEAKRLESRTEAVAQSSRILGEQAIDLQSRLQQQRQRHGGLAEEVEISRSEVQQLDVELAKFLEAAARADADAKDSEATVHTIEAEQKTAEAEIASLEQMRHGEQHTYTTAKVRLAKVEERSDALANRHRQLTLEKQQRSHDLRRLQDNVDTLVARRCQSQQALLHASSELAYTYAAKENAEHDAQRLLREAEKLRQERLRLGRLVHDLRQEVQRLQAEAHGRAMEVNNFRHSLDTLAARLFEEHELCLGELYHGYQPSSQSLDRVGTQTAIDELRRKIGRLGSVSLDALHELQELESRAKGLQDQHEDLANAKKSLEEIIATINGDSRELFLSSLTSIRGHFQELFRKLFGGGMADIVLEDEMDILESGIEINARPPGKELRSISLLSGGEKTLTAVALLLAIFRSKPSPFCILDEVDAALDEANIGRFAALVRDYASQSQFIIITHSKKTMAAADVLYGVTMQEAGVSKRVSVRLEDWPDDVPTDADAQFPPGSAVAGAPIRDAA